MPFVPFVTFVSFVPFVPSVPSVPFVPFVPCVPFVPFVPLVPSVPSVPPCLWLLLRLLLVMACWKRHSDCLCALYSYVTLCGLVFLCNIAQFSSLVPSP